MQPLVSVVIPAHNGALFLAETLQSVLDQSYEHWELLVIDNASQDSTRQVVERFPQAKYSFLKEAGAAQARNLGISLSRGNYIALLDQDDLWTKEKLFKQVSFLETRLDCLACIGMQQIFLEPGYERPSWLKQDHLESPQWAYLPSALMARKEAFLQIGLFDTNFPLAHDVAWFFKARHLASIGQLEEVLVHRRIHDGNLSHESLRLQKEILRVIQASLGERR